MTDKLTGVVAEIRNCKKCRLYRSAHNAVPGEGSLDSSLMLIGEAPGRQEDLMGKPFVGRAGNVLNEMLGNIGMRREDVFITNIVKHRPEGNRDPLEDEIRTCSPYLDIQIKTIKPKLIVTLGNHSTKYIFSRLHKNIKGITSVRGKILDTNLFNLPIKIMPTYHPAAILYNANYRDELEKDFKKIGDIIGPYVIGHNKKKIGTKQVDINEAWAQKELL